MIAAAVALLFVLLVHVVTSALLAVWMGLEVQRARRFVGPALVSGRFAGIMWEIGAIPLGGFVEFQPLDPSNSNAGTVLDRAPRNKRVVLALAPWTLIFTIAMALLGPRLAIETAASSWMLCGAGLEFWNQGPLLVGQIIETILLESPAIVAGLMISALCAWNLLPFPGLSGGMLVDALSPVRLPRWLVIGPALIALGWLISTFVYAFGNIVSA